GRREDSEAAEAPEDREPREGLDVTSPKYGCDANDIRAEYSPGPRATEGDLHHVRASARLSARLAHPAARSRSLGDQEGAGCSGRSSESLRDDVGPHGVEHPSVRSLLHR